MEVKIYQGFASYDFGGRNILFLNLHPTTSLNYVPRADVESDLIALRLAKHKKQAALVSFLPRDREFGVDFNRSKPSSEKALGYYQSFVERDFEKTDEFETRYAWIAGSKEEHELKESVYEGFWNEARRLSSEQTFHVFIHTQATTPRNMPSLIDFVAFNLNEEKVERAVQITNKEYGDEFERIRDELLEYAEEDVRLEESFLVQKFGSLDPSKFSSPARKKYYEKALIKFRGLGHEDLAKRLESACNLEILEEIVEQESTLRVQINC
jgi:hypothetical protein